MDCFYRAARSIHERGVITLQSHHADPFDTAAVTAALLSYSTVSIKGNVWLLATAHILPTSL